MSEEKQSNEGSQQRRPRRRFSRNRPQRDGQQQRHSSIQGSISVVIPLLNEEESLPELARQLENVFERVARGKYEVLFVDDGSTDD